MRTRVLALLGAVVLAIAVGLAVRAGAGRDGDTGSYRLGGETYRIDCDDRGLFMGQWMGPGLTGKDIVFDAWATECGWTGSGPWLTDAP